MQKLIIIASIVLFSGNLFGQDAQIERNNARINSILTDWDPVRGEWLASSLNAMATNAPVTTRIFPEPLTVSQLFSFVPAEKRDSVGELLQENDRLRRLNSVNYLRIGLNVAALLNSVNRRDNTATSTTSGDPHIVDFDKHYTFQSASGEFILLKSATTPMEVQARFEKIDKAASFTTALSMNVGGDRVGIYPNEKPDNVNYTALRVNGEAIRMINKNYYLPMGGLISYENSTYTIHWPGGEAAIVEMKGYQDKKYLNVTLKIYRDNQSDYEGLNAGADEAKSVNDFRVKEENSLFNYAPSRGIDYFLGLENHAVNKRVLPRAEAEAATIRCKEAGVNEEDMEGCVYDLGHYGIIPSPRPEFFHPADEIQLGEVTKRELTENERQIVNQYPNEPVPAKRERREIFDQETKRELGRTFLNIAVSVLGNVSVGGGGTVGR